MTGRSLAAAVALCILALGLPAPSHAAALQRYVSNDPAFVLFKPQDWKVRSGASGGALRISVSDPAGTSAAESVYAGNPQGSYNALRLLGGKLREMHSNHAELAVTDVRVCNRDASCAVATLSYDLRGVPVRGRFFFHADPQLISIRSYTAPLARLSSERALLLDILTNIHVRGGSPPLRFQMVNRRADDGSLGLSTPSDWSFLAAKGTALSGAPGGGAGFIFTVFSMMPSGYGVRPPPGVIVSRYVAPADAAYEIIQKFGHHDIRILGSRYDAATSAGCPQRIGRACDAADVQVSWVNSKGTACTGSFKLLDARPGVTGQWFSIIAGVWGPSNDLGRYLPMLENVGNSFRINDAYAQGYIRNGLANLRVLQRRTAGAIQGLYDAIHENQSDYEARAARKDAQDARGDDYRRGNSYWISDLEGGKVYATDPWGTTDTSNGDRYEGSAYDYIHFDGHNPVHQSDTMHEVSSYDLKQLGY